MRRNLITKVRGTHYTDYCIRVFGRTLIITRGDRGIRDSAS